MITIKVNGINPIEFQSPPSGHEIIKKLSAQDAIAIKTVSGTFDLSHIFHENTEIEIITIYSKEGLEILRHSCAHVLAQAIKELYPDAKISIGPVIENGFFYDIHKKEHLTPDDLPKIEQKMLEIIRRNELVIRKIITKNEAQNTFKEEPFKLEIISDLQEEITIYEQGNFIDLCRGPHVPSTKSIPPYFKLTKLAGAYWRGDSTKPMLQRIYGTAWATCDDLKTYLLRIEEAEKRDHRKLGREMDLFHIQEEAPGSIFWHHKGLTVYRIIENHLRNKNFENGYIEVRSPQIMDKSLWETSGHWESFKENMFITETENKTFAIKPMNCPGHIQIFKYSLKSYRDLPLRMSEFGICHRNEPSGSLHGLMRVRPFVIDDAHIFCTPQQITEETRSFCTLLKQVYKDFGFNDFQVRFSDRPEKRAGSDEVWDLAEESLKKAAIISGLKFTDNPGEGAFYGPKLEFILKDALGREWQCGTWQVDFVLPERFDMEYVGEDGKRHRPVILHRAIVGSLERFIGILLENYFGRLPLWLAPIQVAVLTIVNEVDSYAAEICSILKENGIRYLSDTRAEKISYKIREHSLAKIPVMLLLGRKEAEQKTVTLRKGGTENNQEVLTINDMINQLINEIKKP